LNVKRNSAHGQSSAFVAAPVLRAQRAWPLKGPLRTSRRPGSRRDVQGARRTGILVPTFRSPCPSPQ
jgi:hypothetical protein